MTPARNPWDPSAPAPADVELDLPFDIVEIGTFGRFMGASTEIPNGVPIEAWIDDVVTAQAGGCGVPRSRQSAITIDGQPGRVAACHNTIEATVVAGGRPYLFRTVHDGSLTGALFNGVLGTVDLRPEGAAAPRVSVVLLTRA